MKSFDALILGAGPAGLTAALYLVRGGMSTALVEKGAPVSYTHLLDSDMGRTYNIRMEPYIHMLFPTIPFVSGHCGG